MPRVKVMVRSRPVLGQEQGQPATRIETNEIESTVRVQSTSTNGKIFTFDTALPETSTQEEVFEHVVPMIDHALDGLHATVFAYGQTGSGKTFTMEGVDYQKDGSKLRPNPETPIQRHGIILRTIEALFERARARMARDPNIQYRIQVSYMQLYNEKVSDLLNPSLPMNAGGLKIRWNRNNKFTVDNLFHLECESSAEARELFFMGIKNKVMGSHSMNQQSSRSHSLFTFYITAHDPADRDATVSSELTLVDLAGSEKLALLSADPSQQLVKESIEINASLLALGKVITALANASRGKSGTHVPYRDSKLTKLLQHALGGNSMTTMIACICPLDAYVDETISTLLYAGRARNITNDPRVNEDPRTKLIRQLREEILSLKEQLSHLQLACSAGLRPSVQPDLHHPQPHEDQVPHGTELADKLIASCEMLKHLIDVNSKLRASFDDLVVIKSEADRREVELQAENLCLRERIEVLEGIVLADSDDPRPEVVSRARAATPTPPTESRPRNELNLTASSRPSSLRESVDANRTATKANSQQQRLTAYSKKYRDPRSGGNYAEYYGLAVQATSKVNGRQAKIVEDVEHLLRKSGPKTAAMVPLSLQSTGNYGSLAFGGTHDEVEELEQRRRRRAERKAALEEQHRRLQQGFVNVDAALSRSAEPHNGERNSSADQLFNYLTASESSSVFTDEQLRRLRERRGVAPCRPSGSEVTRSFQREAARDQEYRSELQNAQSLVATLARQTGK